MLDRLKRVVDPYILLMFATVGLAAVAPAHGRGAAAADTAADAGIVFLFFLYGARLSPRAAWDGLRRWIGDWVQAHKKVLGLADRGSILLIIYAAFSKGMEDHIWSQLSLRDLLVLGVLLAVLLALALGVTAFIARRLLRLSVEDEIVLQFCGSKKSLASGLPMASVMFAGPQLGLIVLPLMLFHQLQLIVCAVLARRYAARGDEGDPTPRSGLSQEV